MAERDPRSGTIAVNRKAFHDYEILEKVARFAKRNSDSGH